MSEIKIKLLGDKVLIEPIEAESKTASGIIIPDTVKEKPQKGKIVAVGNGNKEEAIRVKVGDVVIYNRNIGTDIKINDTNYLIMRQSDILAII